MPKYYTTGKSRSASKPILKMLSPAYQLAFSGWLFVSNLMFKFMFSLKKVIFRHSTSFGAFFFCVFNRPVAPFLNVISCFSSRSLQVLLNDRARRLLTPCSLKRFVVPRVAFTRGHSSICLSSAIAYD